MEPTKQMQFTPPPNPNFTLWHVMKQYANRVYCCKWYNIKQTIVLASQIVLMSFLLSHRTFFVCLLNQGPFALDIMTMYCILYFVCFKFFPPKMIILSLWWVIPRNQKAHQATATRFIYELCIYRYMCENLAKTKIFHMTLEVDTSY